MSVEFSNKVAIVTGGSRGAALALFLCSQEAQHIQGTAIAVDGGSTVG